MHLNNWIRLIELVIVSLWRMALRRPVSTLVLELSMGLTAIKGLQAIELCDTLLLLRSVMVYFICKS